MSDLASVDAVLHHQDLQLLDVVHEELLEAGRQHMTGALGGSVTDVGHQVLSLEAATHSVVNSLRLAPVLLQGERERPGLGTRLTRVVRVGDLPSAWHIGPTDGE